MAYASPFLLVKSIGAFGSSGNTELNWSVSLKFPVTGSLGDDTVLAFLQGLEQPFKTMHAGVAAGNNCYINGLSGAIIGTNGRYEGGGLQTTKIHMFSTPGSSTGSPIHPLATSTVFTFKGLIARGRASRGRVYWPALAVEYDPPDQRMSTTRQNSLVASGRDWLRAVNVVADTAPNIERVAIMSGIGAGATSPITQVGVGRKPDHQERRENPTREEHVYQTL